MLMMDKRRKPHHIALDNTAFYAKCEKHKRQIMQQKHSNVNRIKRAYTNILKGD